MKEYMNSDFREYTSFVDQLLEQYYRGQPGLGLERYFWFIEEWLADPSPCNRPLVIEGAAGAGKKTLLMKWKEYHESHCPDDIVLVHFATAGGSNSSYYFAIYRTLVKLRELLNISQKVELHEEKLRKYLSYWLEVCDRSIQAQVINGAEKVFSRIVLVLEGVDFFINRETQREGNLAFWLPSIFPPHIRVIISAQPQSASMQLLREQGCKLITVEPRPSTLATLIDLHLGQDLLPPAQVQQRLLFILQGVLTKSPSPLFVMTFLTTLLPAAKLLSRHQQALAEIDFGALERTDTIAGLIDFVIDFWGKRLTANEKVFSDLLFLLISTQKGLLMGELEAISKASAVEIREVQAAFSHFVIEQKELLMIKSHCIKSAIARRFGSRRGNGVHEKIAAELGKTPNSLRKLEEQCFHLYLGRNYFKLKEVISDVQNFLLLFNRYNKYDLCRYWQVLEVNSFDPVIEYNKAIEGFQMHYHPSSQDLFRIIVQISRFLKEFSDFETAQTPDFRHPKIVGGKQALQDICMLGELTALNLCQIFEKIQNRGAEEIPQPRTKLIRGKVSEKMGKLFGFKKTSKLLRKPKREPSRQQVKAESRLHWAEKEVEVTKANVDIPTNRTRFRRLFYQQVISYIEKHNLFLEGEEDEKEDRRESRKIDFGKLGEMGLSEEAGVPRDYYYKRWIWMQFPWVCISLKVDYSGKLKQCFTSPTKYMSVREESEFTNQSLNIALQAKMRKQSVLKERLLAAPQGEALGRPSRSVNQKHARRTELNHSQSSFSREDYLIVTRQRLEAGRKGQRVEPSAFLTQIKFRPLIAQDDIQDQRELNLPSIQSSLNREIVRDITKIEDTNILLRKKVDQLSHKNLVMSKRLHQLRTIEKNNIITGKNLRRIQSLRAEIEQLRERTEHIKEGYCYSLLEKERLNILIRICKHNKTQNVQFLRPITFQATNFKKMIKWEAEDINRTRKRTEQLRAQTTALLRRSEEEGLQRERQRITLLHVLHEQEVFGQRFSQFGDILSNSISNPHKQEKEDQPGKDRGTNQLERLRLQEELVHLRQKRQALARLLPLENDLYLGDPRFLQFKENVEKREQFNHILALQEEKIRSMRAKLQARKEHLSVLYKASEGSIEMEIVSSTGLMEEKRKQPDISTRKRIEDQERSSDRLLQIQLACLGTMSYLKTKLRIEPSANFSERACEVVQAMLEASKAMRRDGRIKQATRVQVFRRD